MKPRFTAGSISTMRAIAPRCLSPVPDNPIETPPLQRELNNFNCLPNFRRVIGNAAGDDSVQNRDNLWISLNILSFRRGIRNKCSGYQERSNRVIGNIHSGYQEQGQLASH